MSSLNMRRMRATWISWPWGPGHTGSIPGVIPFRKARSLDIHVSGGEYNVAAGLADCFGLRTGIATAMVKYPIGELVQARVRETGRDSVLQVVRARRRARAEYRHGLQRPGLRGPPAGRLLQPVRTRPAALLKPGDFDWAADLRPRRALVPLRGHLRRALRDDSRR